MTRAHPPTSAQANPSWGLRSMAEERSRENIGTACRPHILSVPSWLPGKGCTGEGGERRECFLPGQWEGSLTSCPGKVTLSL